MKNQKQTAYVSPRITTLAQDELLEALGPAMAGYGGTPSSL